MIRVKSRLQRVLRPAFRLLQLIVIVTQTTLIVYNARSRLMRPSLDSEEYRTLHLLLVRVSSKLLFYVAPNGIEKFTFCVFKYDS